MKLSLSDIFFEVEIIKTEVSTSWHLKIENGYYILITGLLLVL